MRPHLTVALLATLASLTLAGTAQAFTLGVGDRADAPTAPSAMLGATTYRVVIDPAVPLQTYDTRIYMHRAVGQEPQLVIGGTGTANHASSRGIVRAAVAAAKRWPSAYSISVVNEPNESGMSVCEYARTYLAAYRSLKAIGVKRVLFGEWSPNNTIGWQSATLNPRRCHRTALALRGKIRDVAWHGYTTAIEFGPAIRWVTRQLAHQTPRLYVTEAGYVINSQGFEHADTEGVRYWRHALNIARRDLEQIVVWELHDSSPPSAWISGLIDAAGRPRPAFQLLASAAH